MRLVMGALNRVWLRDLLTGSTANCQHIRAAVAYVHAHNPLLDHCKRTDKRLQLYALLDADCAVPPAVLEDLLDRGPSRVDCRLIRGRFHAKVIWWVGYGMYIGSANLTSAAWSENVECGVFYDDDEIETMGLDEPINTMFDYLDSVAVPLTRELVEKLKRVRDKRLQLRDDERAVGQLFDRLFESLPPHRGLGVVASHGTRANARRERFVREHQQTLELMRGLAREFSELDLRPVWVAPDAHPAVHFDQFLHAYYYDFVRGGVGDDEVEEKTVEAVERAHGRNRADPKRALREAAEWWAGLDAPPYGEGVFIAEVAPRMRELFSDASLATMDEANFREAIGSVNAFRVHARQMRNSQFNLPHDHHEDVEAKVNRLANWLWTQRSPRGHSVRDVLRFLIWGSRPSDMEERLWLAAHDEEWRLPHFGRSTLGEAVGWARPDAYPPRNNRTNKGLRSLGHAVELYYA